MSTQFAYFPNGPAALPAAFAPPNNQFSGPQAFHLAVDDSAFPNLNLTFGANASQFVYDTVYVSTDGQTWTQFTLTGGAKQFGHWFSAAATLVLPSTGAQYGAIGTLGKWTYVAYLVVDGTSTGMRNASGPILPLKWNLQAFSRLPLPIITLNPVAPSIPDTTAKGAVVATVTVTMDDGSPFTGTLGFVAPNVDAGGIFSLTGSGSSFNVIVNPNGPGVGPNTGNITDNITLEALQ
jgi:hypothetical protein